MFYTYALYNNIRNKVYIGQSEDLEKRLRRHNGQLPNKRTSFTAKNKGEWFLIHKEQFATRKEAIQREKQLKTQRGREFIWNIINK